MNPAAALALLLLRLCLQFATSQAQTNSFKFEVEKNSILVSEDYTLPLTLADKKRLLTQLDGIDATTFSSIEVYGFKKGTQKATEQFDERLRLLVMAIDPRRPGNEDIQDGPGATEKYKTTAEKYLNVLMGEYDKYAPNGQAIVAGSDEKLLADMTKDIFGTELSKMFDGASAQTFEGFDEKYSERLTGMEKHVKAIEADPRKGAKLYAGLLEAEDAAKRKLNGAYDEMEKTTPPTDADLKKLVEERLEEVRKLEAGILSRPPKPDEGASLLETSGPPGTFAALDSAYQSRRDKFPMHEKLANLKGMKGRMKEAVGKLNKVYDELAKTVAKPPSSELATLLKNVQEVESNAATQFTGLPTLKKLDESYVRQLKGIQTDKGDQFGGLKLRVDEAVGALDGAFDDAAAANTGAKTSEKEPYEYWENLLKGADEKNDYDLLGVAATPKPDKLETLDGGILTKGNELKKEIDRPENADYEGLRLRGEELLRRLPNAFLSLVKELQLESQFIPQQKEAFDSIEDLKGKKLDELLPMQPTGKYKLAEVDQKYNAALDKLWTGGTQSLYGLRAAALAQLKRLSAAYNIVALGRNMSPPLSDQQKEALGQLRELEEAKTNSQVLGKKDFGKSPKLEDVDKQHAKRRKEVQKDFKEAFAELATLEGLQRRLAFANQAMNEAYGRIMPSDRITANDQKQLAASIEAIEAKSNNDIFFQTPQAQVKMDDLDQNFDSKHKNMVGQLRTAANSQFEGLRFRAHDALQRMLDAYLALGLVSDATGKPLDALKTLSEVQSQSDPAKVLDFAQQQKQQPTLEAVDTAFKTRYEQFNLDDPEVSKLAGVKRAIEGVALPKMGSSYNKLVSKLKPNININAGQEKMLQILGEVETASAENEVLGDEKGQLNSKLADQQLLQMADNFMAQRYEGVRGGRNLIFGSLPGLKIRIRKAYSRVNDAFQQLAGGKILANSPEKELLDSISAIEDNAKTPTEVIMGPGGQDPSDFAELDKNYNAKLRNIGAKQNEVGKKKLTGMLARAREATDNLRELRNKLAEKLLSGGNEKKWFERITEIEEAMRVWDHWTVLGLARSPPPSSRAPIDAAYNKSLKELREMKFKDKSLQARVRKAMEMLQRARDSLIADLGNGGSGGGGGGQTPQGDIDAELAKETDGKPPEIRTGCGDTAQNCLDNLRLCNVRGYVRVMHKQCAHACVVCMAPGERCEDNNKFDCPTWKSQGYCDSKLHTKGMKMRQCGMSCGLCPPAGG